MNEELNTLLTLAYAAGVRSGKKQMMDKIEKQYELGKPILANDNLYWLKNATDNLNDIMDDMESEYMSMQ